MVGVPGRSKGCSTCRRRRKGCDKGFPFCDQCIKARLKCGGYARDLVWVNSVGDATAHSGSSNCYREQSTTNKAVQKPWAVQYSRAIISDDVEVTLPDPLVKSSREQLYIGMFCTSSLPYGRPYSSRAANLSSNGWPRIVSSLCNSDGTLRQTAVAVSAAVIGAQQNDNQLRLSGLQAYHNSIREMAKALGRPHQFQSDGLTAANRMMQLYELFFGNFSNWHRHLEGNIALILQRGPEGFTTDSAHQIFTDSRILAVMLYFGRREPSPFSTREWRTTPWRAREKSTKDLLIDILDDIPELLQQLDEFQGLQGGVERDKSLQRLHLRCREIEVALYAWKRRVGNDLERFDYTATSLPIAPPDSDVEFALLHLTSLYWVACLLLYSTLAFASRQGNPQTLQVKPHGAHVSSAATPLAALRKLDRQDIFAPTMDARLFGCKIAHAIHLSFEPGAGFVQSGSALFPLAVALRYFATLDAAGQPTPEVEMLRALYRKPFMGGHVGRFLEPIEGSPRHRTTKQASTYTATQMKDKIWWYELMRRQSSSSQAARV